MPFHHSLAWPFFGLAEFLSLCVSVNAQVAGNATAGETTFKQRCVMCHATVPSVSGRPGPNLAGVYGRKAGSTTFNYSAEMRKSTTVWNAASLDRFLRSPSTTVPGTRMTVSVTDEAARRNLVAYLGKLRAQKPKTR